MAGGSGESRGGMLRPLSIGYLVWHCVSMLVASALLGLLTAAYAGAFATAGELPQVVEVAGVATSVWLLVASGWVLVALVAVAGLMFGVGAYRLPSAPGALRRTVVLGRVMFVLCALDVLFAFVRGDGVLTVTSLASALLTGALALEVRSFGERSCDIGSAPRASFVVDAVERVPAREAELAEEGQRRLFRATSGYATTMLVWGALRILAGVSVVFSVRDLSDASAPVASVALGLVIAAFGAYFVFVGRLGKRALVGGSSARSFLVASTVGLVASLGVLVVYALWSYGGWRPGVQEVFTSAIDAALFAAGCLYGRRFSRSEISRK